jgi:hypothetical protein
MWLAIGLTIQSKLPIHPEKVWERNELDINDPRYPNKLEIWFAADKDQEWLYRLKPLES